MDKKGKTQIYAVYKRLNINTKTQIGKKINGHKKIYHRNGRPKKTGVDMLISRWNTPQEKKIISDEEGIS